MTNMGDSVIIVLAELLDTRRQERCVNAAIVGSSWRHSGDDMPDVFVPTRYLSLSSTEDGTLILYNSRTGAIGAVPPAQAGVAKAALKRSARHTGPFDGLMKDLHEGGFLIPEGTNEHDIIHQQYLTKYSDHDLHLIILPTEQCNFRCIYCYESFLRGTMSEEIREGIRQYVAKQQRLKQLEVSWFGGEPLLAADVVIELSQYFHHFCAERDIRFTAGITTNGSLLTPDVADQIIPLGVRNFQITIDGEAHEHDKRRVLQDGGATFDSILNNLRYLKSTNYKFLVSLRHNFDPEGLGNLDTFISRMKHEFGGDPRFTMIFKAIGKWGGANDLNLSVCDGQAATQATIYAHELAIEAGFRNGFVVHHFRPNGYVCYAANPRSFVIGSDGSIYKCTVELDYHDRNIVGKLHPDGHMDLDWRKMALWCETNGHAQESKKCNSCFFSPTCHGAFCPKEWMDENDCACPHEKVAIRQVLPIIFKEFNLSASLQTEAVSQCTKG